MKLNQHHIALAASATCGIFYSIHAALLTIYPKLYFSLMSAKIHLIDPDRYMGDFKVTPYGFVYGFAQAIICTYISGWIFAYLFNRFENE